MLIKQDVFQARQGGYRTYRVPGILCTANNIILATVEARRGHGGDWEGNDVLMRRSLDGGQSWQSPQLIVGCDQYGPGPISNFVMINDRGDGRVHALYCHNYERVFYMCSMDDGATFSEPSEITESLLAFCEQYPWRVIATGPGHGIQLMSGRLVAPVWMSDGSGTEFGAGKLGHRPSEVASIYSDDHGRSWQCGEFVAHTDEQIINPSETVPVELNNGRVLFNIRSESPENRRLVSISAGAGYGWPAPHFDQALLEPVCMGSILRLKHQENDGPDPILFVNPDNLENTLIPDGGNLAHDRKRLTAKLSTDDCQTWPVSRILEEGPSGYSDLAETADGTVLCIYECGMIEHMTDTRAVTVARFDLSWLKQDVF